MENLALISIVVPIYNVEKYIAKCLDSIIGQSYRNLEIILVEDCSCDKSYEIIQKYAERDSRINIVKNDYNKGLSTSRNNGIKVSKGKYITFIDSDDFISTTYIEDLYETIIESKVNMVMPEFILFDDKKKSFSKDDYHSNKIIKNNNNSIQLIKKEKIFSNLLMFNVHATKLFNLEVIKNNNLQFPSNLAFEDNPFTIEYLLLDSKSEIAINSNAIYFYRQNVKNAITKANSKFRDIFKINKLVKDIFIKHNCFNEYRDAINYYFCNSIYYWGLITRENQLNRDMQYFKEASDFINNEIEKVYIDDTLRLQNKGLYKTIQAISKDYKSFYYRKLIKQYYKNSGLDSLCKVLEKIAKGILTLSIRNILKIIKYSLKFVVVLLFKIPFRAYETFK